MPISVIVLLPVTTLLGGVLLQACLTRWLPAQWKGWLALATCLVALVGVLALWPAIIEGQILDVHLTQWYGPAALTYHIDGLSLLFALLAVGIGSAVLLYSVAYMDRDPASTRFYMFMLVFIAGLVNLVYSADLLLIYLSWELIGLCSFLLVGFWYTEKEAAAGARKVLVMTHLAGYGLLAAVILIYVRTGSTLWTDPRVSATFGTGLFVLMLVAAIAKSVQFPLHTWIPDAMAAPTPVSALLHAACYVKAGVYLIARLHSLGVWPVAWQELVIWIGTITMLVGVLFAVVQSDLKRLLAFHTVSQIGYMVMGLGLGTPLGIAAGLLHCLNHAFFKGGLFLCAGAVERATGTRDMDRLGGLASRMPVTAASWLVLAGSISGIPLLSGFVSKWLLYNAALEAGQVIPALISWMVSVLTLFSFLKATSGIFLGEVGNYPEGLVRTTPRTMLIGTGILAGGSLLLGVAPQLAVRYLINPVLLSLGMLPMSGVSWAGLTVSGGNWFATVGFILALIAIGAGFLIYWVSTLTGRQIAEVSMGTAGGVFTGGEPLITSTRLPASDFSLVFRQGLAPFYRWLDMDRYYRIVWQGLQKASGRVQQVSEWLEWHTLPVMLVFIVGLIVILSLAVPTAVFGTAAVPPISNLAAEGPITGIWLVVAGSSIALLSLLAVAYTTSIETGTLLLMILCGLPAVLGLASAQSTVRLLFLESAALLSIVLVWRTAENRGAFYAYLASVLLSSALVIFSTLLLSSSTSNLLWILLLIGLGIKLAVVPFYVWLPRVAGSIPSTVVGLIVTVLDMAFFGEFLALRQAVPVIFNQSGLWSVLAVLSALVGAVLMVAQRDLKRMLAFSTIEDLGILLFGAAAGGEIGLVGALLGAGIHSLAKALLFASLSRAEIDGAVTLSRRGIASRYPVSAAGFLVGMLATLGIPPTGGFLARWPLYVAATQTNAWLLAAFLLASALALLAYSKAIARIWWGPGDHLRTREPGLLVFVLVTMSLPLVLMGIWPGFFVR